MREDSSLLFAASGDQLSIKLGALIIKFHPDQYMISTIPGIVILPLHNQLQFSLINASVVQLISSVHQLQLLIYTDHVSVIFDQLRIRLVAVVKDQVALDVFQKSSIRLIV